MTEEERRVNGLRCKLSRADEVESRAWSPSAGAALENKDSLALFTPLRSGTTAVQRGCSSGTEKPPVVPSEPTKKSRRGETLPLAGRLVFSELGVAVPAVASTPDPTHTARCSGWFQRRH